MDELDYSIISALFVSKIVNNDPIEIVRKKELLSKEIVEERVTKMIDLGLVEKDRKTITEFGRNSVKIVLAGGVFDIIHPGHIHTLNEAKDLGDILVVVIATDQTAQKMKKREPLHDQKSRQELVSSLSMVDLCIIGDENDIFRTVDNIKPDIIALGYDQAHQERFIVDGCRKLNLEITVSRLKTPIPETSSSTIEKEYGKDIHGI